MDLSFLLSVLQRRKGRTAATKSAKLVKKLNEQVCLYSYVHPYTETYTYAYVYTRICYTVYVNGSTCINVVSGTCVMC